MAAATKRKTCSDQIIGVHRSRPIGWRNDLLGWRNDLRLLNGFELSRAGRPGGYHFLSPELICFVAETGRFW
ncbi:hypothetical protein [Bradyrhizobium sp. RDM4]|uniref:hypothetical protein n=1 Tax=Bradyrhizobium sp. RDM4 TaxID=3378765 RepID=UPI0038FD2EEC